MANDIYLQTHDGLAAMVSARVATRVLQNVLKDQGLNADGISGGEMSKLLMGPVFKELEHTLPREGLKRNLKALAAGVQPAREAARVAPEPRDRSAQGDPQSLPAFKAQLASILTIDKDDEPEAEQGPAGKGDDSAEAPIAPLLRKIEAELAEIEQEDTAGSPPQAVKPNAPKAGPNVQMRAPKPKPATVSRNLNAKGLEQAVLRFAQIDHVTLVAALHKDGNVATSRGSGLDLQALARYGLMGLKLLQRNQPLSSYYLAHTRGQLFLLPIGTDVIIVVGTPELNIGAVFAALATLKEEV